MMPMRASTYFKYQAPPGTHMAAGAYVPNSQQKTWMLVEAALKQLSRRSKSYFDSQKIADAANRIAKNDPFYASVGHVTTAKISSRCRTWIEAGFVLERAGTFVRHNPWEIPPKGITTKPYAWRWIGGNVAATIPGHPQYGDTYHRRQVAAFKKSIRKKLGL
jgi:hypothetical protein